MSVGRKNKYSKKFHKINLNEKYYLLNKTVNSTLFKLKFSHKYVLSIFKESTKIFKFKKNRFIRYKTYHMFFRLKLFSNNKIVVKHGKVQ